MFRESCPRNSTVLVGLLLLLMMPLRGAVAGGMTREEEVREEIKILLDSSGDIERKTEIRATMSEHPEQYLGVILEEVDQLLKEDGGGTAYRALQTSLLLTAVPEGREISVSKIEAALGKYFLRDISTWLVVWQGIVTLRLMADDDVPGAYEATIRSVLALDDAIYRPRQIPNNGLSARSGLAGGMKRIMRDWHLPDERLVERFLKRFREKPPWMSKRAWSDVCTGYMYYFVQAHWEDAKTEERLGEFLLRYGPELDPEAKRTSGKARRELRRSIEKWAPRPTPVVPRGCLLQ